MDRNTELEKRIKAAAQAYYTDDIVNYHSVIYVYITLVCKSVKTSACKQFK